MKANLMLYVVAAGLCVVIRWRRRLAEEASEPHTLASPRSTDVAHVKVTLNQKIKSKSTDEKASESLNGSNMCIGALPAGSATASMSGAC